MTVCGRASDGYSPSSATLPHILVSTVLLQILFFIIIIISDLSEMMRKQSGTIFIHFFRSSPLLIDSGDGQSSGGRLISIEKR